MSDSVTPWTVAHQAPLSVGILQARILEWVAISSSGELLDPGMEPASLTSPAQAGGFFTTSATWEAIYNVNYASIKSLKKVSPGEHNIQGMGVITAMTENSFSLEVYNMRHTSQYVWGPLCW